MTMTLTFEQLTRCLQCTVRAGTLMHFTAAGQRSRRRAARLLAALEGLAPDEEADAPSEPAELSAPQLVLQELRRAERVLTTGELHARLPEYTSATVRNAVYQLGQQGLVRAWRPVGRRWQSVELLAPASEAASLPARPRPSAAEPRLEETVVGPSGRHQYAVPPREAVLRVLQDCPALTKAELKERLWQMEPYTDPAVEKALRQLKSERRVRVGRLQGRNAALVQLLAEPTDGPPAPAVH